MQEKKALLKPKIDVVFHSLFRKGNERITKAIISSATKEKIDSIDLDNDRYIIGEYPEEKLGILDLKATLDNGTICNIEIQLADNKDTAERFLYYWSRIYSGQLVKGEEYKNLNKVISIIIIDYNFEKTKEIESLSTKWKIKEVETGKEIELTDMLELIIIELPKARRILEKEPENKLAQWMLFLNNPNELEVSNMVENNEDIKEAMNELEQISEDKKLRRLAELREKYIRDSHAEREYAIEEGLKEGMAKGMAKGMKEGLEKGLEKGLEQGIQQGLQQGTKESKINIAKNMLKRGMNVQDVVDITELTYNQVIKLKEEI